MQCFEGWRDRPMSDFPGSGKSRLGVNTKGSCGSATNTIPDDVSGFGLSASIRWQNGLLQDLGNPRGFQAFDQHQRERRSSGCANTDSINQTPSWKTAQ